MIRKPKFTIIVISYVMSQILVIERPNSSDFIKYLLFTAFTGVTTCIGIMCLVFNSIFISQYKEVLVDWHVMGWMYECIIPVIVASCILVVILVIQIVVYFVSKPLSQNGCFLVIIVIITELVLVMALASSAIIAYDSNEIDLNSTIESTSGKYGTTEELNETINSTITNALSYSKTVGIINCLGWSLSIVIYIAITVQFAIMYTCKNSKRHGK